MNIALIGYGYIARHQHQPVIQNSRNFNLVAVVDPDNHPDPEAGLASFQSLDELLEADLSIDAVVLAIPPQHRYDMAKRAMAAGLHVLLEKPPCTTISAANLLTRQATNHGVTIHASWHSRHAPAINAAYECLVNQNIRAINIDWREDVRQFHPNQDWIWQPGGFGVLDPGINALSILTYIQSRTLVLQQGVLDIPANCDTPITAELDFIDSADSPIHAFMDWAHEGPPNWQILIQTDQCEVRLENAGADLYVDGDLCLSETETEYEGVYEKFAKLIQHGRSHIDLRPLNLAGDALMLSKRRSVLPFWG